MQHATTTTTTRRRTPAAVLVRTRSVVAASIVALTLALTACTGSGHVQPEEAKNSIVSVVDDTTATIGGHWKVYSEPTAESCTEAADDRVLESIRMLDNLARDPMRFRVIGLTRSTDDPTLFRRGAHDKPGINCDAVTTDAGARLQNGNARVAICQLDRSPDVNV